MNYGEMRQAVSDAEQTVRLANIALQTTAHLLKGKLKAAEIDSYILRELKKELRKFNMHTGEWKD